MMENAEQLSETAAMDPVTSLLLGLIAVVVGVVIMWLAAIIVHVRDATFGRTVFATLMMSALTVGAVSMISRSTENALIAVGVAAVVGAVMAIKLIYRTTVWKAAGVLILNVMMQIIISSLYIQARLGGVVTSGPS